MKQSSRRRIAGGSSLSMLLSVIFVCLSTVGASSFQENGILGDDDNSMSTTAHASLRGDSHSSSSSSSPRQHVIRRIYGEENALVRKELSKLEERMERSQTGLNGDPNHKLDYGDYHPYDPEVRRRVLEEGDGEFEDVYRPLRIHFETYAMDEERTVDNAAKIDFIKREILDRTREFWSEALSVVPVKGNLFISTAELDNRAFCGDSEFTEVKTEHISDGVPQSDLVLYVSATASTRFCSGSTLAVAVACNFDQFDRPTAGAINFCLDQIELRADGTASESIIQDNVDVAIHEAAHVLGMSSNSYRFFWDPTTGKPRTPRQFTTSTVTCVDGQTRSLILPDENTMKFFLAGNGQRYASIVTPKVQAVARNQFDCQSLAGGQLENQPTGSESCTGDHWDERLFYPEALSGVISPTTNILSHITLALMEDSGWYKANFTMGRTSPWGLGAGCDFASSDCLQPGNPPVLPESSKGFFCNEGAKRGCSPSLTHKMACTLIDYSYVNPLNAPDPKFQYFTSSESRGGPRQADYCPLYGSTYQGLDAEQLDCSNPANVDSINFYNEVYGEDSKCFETSTGEGRCYRAACVKDEMAVKINIRGQWHQCDYDFQEVSVRVGGGALSATVRCPRLSTACPDLFCPFNCAGRGTCNFANVENGIVVPKCECFDETDTSPGCSDSLIPDGSFIADSGDLLNNLEEDFFDPLISVFVDHPDKWTTASWAWAAGLLALFLVMLLCICSSFWPTPQKGRGRRY